MNLSLGIVGLPNVGKSTLFNALTMQQVAAENFPFCTIEPNTGIVPVVDERLGEIASIVKPRQKIDAVVKFVDIAGIVKGAAEGEGLGNMFLAHIREVDAIVHVVRSFESKNITHVESRIDPKSDREIIESELILKDLETLEKRNVDLSKRARTDSDFEPVVEEITKLKTHLEQGRSAQSFIVQLDETRQELKSLHLLTQKPVLYLLNSTKDTPEHAAEITRAGLEGENVVVMDVLIESELAPMDKDERKEYMTDLGLGESGLERLTKSAYALLGLISFFTAGEQEARAWTIKQGSRAPKAAGEIHTDFEKKFIAAEVISYEDFISGNGEQGARDAGNLRLEGREYIVANGDVITFKHGA
jgi:hypothetical protein